MLTVTFKYKTIEDAFHPGDAVGLMAESMLLITQQFSDGKNITGIGRGILSNYFEGVPNSMRADVFVEYLEMLEDDGFDTGVIKEQAKL